jgi:segregation and condensation protein B
METDRLKYILEAALLASERPLAFDTLMALFEEGERPERDAVREALDALRTDYKDRGVELREVASGYRIQVRPDYQRWVSRLWEERAPRYSRALMETLALIAYRQPVTRGEIEAVRGVSVSTNIIRTLRERDWVQVVGHRDVPGKPALYATSRKFLDYFNLKSLDDLPSLSELRDIDQIEAELNFETPSPATATVTVESDATADAETPSDEDRDQDSESPDTQTDAESASDSGSDSGPESDEEPPPVRAAHRVS